MALAAPLMSSSDPFAAFLEYVVENPQRHRLAHCVCVRTAAVAVAVLMIVFIITVSIAVVWIRSAITAHLSLQSGDGCVSLFRVPAL